MILSHRYAGENADGLSHEQIGSELGLSHESVRRLEHSALVKVRIGLVLIDMLGRHEAAPVLTRLRGRPLATFIAELERARTVAIAARRPR